MAKPIQLLGLLLICACRDPQPRSVRLADVITQVGQTWQVAQQRQAQSQWRQESAALCLATDSTASAACVDGHAPRTTMLAACVQLVDFSNKHVLASVELVGPPNAAPLPCAAVGEWVDDPSQGHEILAQLSDNASATDLPPLRIERLEQMLARAQGQAEAAQVLLALAGRALELQLVKPLPMQRISKELASWDRRALTAFNQQMRLSLQVGQGSSSQELSDLAAKLDIVGVAFASPSSLGPQPRRPLPQPSQVVTWLDPERALAQKRPWLLWITVQALPGEDAQAAVALTAQTWTALAATPFAP